MTDRMRSGGGQTQTEGKAQPKRQGGGGWKVGLMGVVLCVLAGFGLVRTEPLPEPPPKRAGPMVRWGGGAGGALGLAERLVGEPTVFALGGSAGFTHGLNVERPRARPPVGGDRGGVREAPAADPAWRPEWARAEFGNAPGLPPGPSGTGVRRADPAVPEVSAPTLEFSEGWTPRVFGGVDLDYGAWTAAAWTAEAEIAFDGAGVPERVFLTERSGLDAVDRRLAREAWRWRLRDGGAAREGRVRWRVPAPAARPADAAEGEGS